MNLPQSKSNPNQSTREQGRNMDFSFKHKILPHIFSRENKEEPKKQQNCQSSHETRDVQVTLSPVRIEKAHFDAIKRLDQKIEQADNMLSNIIEVENQNNDNFHLFQNIRYSGQSEQSQSQDQTEVKMQPFIAEEKEEKQVKEAVVERDKTTYRVSVLIKDQTTSKFVQLDFTRPNVYENQILVLKNFNQYKREAMNIFRLSNLRIGEQKINLKNVKKITLFPFTLKKSQFQIQLIHSKGRIIFGAELKRHLYFLPEHYIWFAKIINAKLMILGFQMGNSAHILNSKINMGWNGIYSEGFIFKKSKYLKKWSKRYVVINSEGLFSYKEKNQNYTIFIPMQEIRVISTEFELYEGNLVIRLQTQQLKIDFAIPIQDYCIKIQNNWLFAYYRLLMEHKHPIKIA